MYEAKQNKRKDSRISSYFSTGSSLQLVDNRKRNSNRLCIQMNRHVRATCSITTKEKGKQDATCTSQTSYPPDSIVQEMNRGLQAKDNALYQCAEPKSLSRLLGRNGLNKNNLIRDELRTIRWSNIHYYDRDNSNLGIARPCATCLQWINPDTLKPRDEAINKVSLTYETEEDRERAKEQKEEECEVTESYNFKNKKGRTIAGIKINNSEIGNIKKSIEREVNAKAKGIKVVNKGMNIYISYSAIMQKNWMDIKEEISILKEVEPCITNSNPQQ